MYDAGDKNGYGGGSEGPAGLGVLGSKSTLALGAVLVLAVVMAQIMVSGRSGQVRALDEARARGADIIDEVRVNGLAEYLGRKSIVRYYLLESEGRTNGYAAILIEPVIDDDHKLFYRIKDFFARGEGNFRSRSSLVITDDLTEYVYSSVRQLSTKAGVQVVSQKQYFQDGILTGYSAYGLRKIERAPVQIERKNMIPLSLLDFFSSLAGRSPSREDAIFTLVDFDLAEEMSELAVELRISFEAKVPERIVARDPTGAGVKVDWLNHYRRQNIYYDQEHQIVWQEDLPEPSSVMRAVERAEVEKAFPEADQILNGWLKKKGGIATFSRRDHK